jgi:hypothetical protein
MGKLLFVNTNRTNGIVGLIASLLFVGVGVASIVSGSYVGLVGVLFGLLLGAFCLKIATQRSEIYEQGFASKSIFGSQAGRYADLKSIIRGAVRTNGVVTTRVQLVDQSGKRLTVSREALGQGDKESQLLLDRACTCMAESWAKKMERCTEVVWLTKGSSPLLKIRKDGVLVEGATGADGFVPLSQMRVQPKQVGLAVDILNGDRKVITVNSGEPNYYVGLALIAMILEKQTHSFAAGARN